MLDYLVNHAIKNVWCTPDQDLQTIFRPARVTKINGEEDDFWLMWYRYPMPTKNERYHVYQLGKWHPKNLGLRDINSRWIKFSEICETEEIIVDFYVADGTQFPRSDTWAWIGPDGALLIAVKVRYTIADLNHQPLFVRFYSNAHFGSDRQTEDDKIIVKGRQLASSTDRILFQRDFEDHQALVGHAYAFVNGKLTHNVTPNNAQVGDYVEFVYDSTIYRVVDVRIKDLGDYESVKDNKRKYLVHYPEMLNDTIDYLDDVDFWLTDLKDDSPNGAFTGVYYHKNEPSSVRMVTHMDYALRADLVAAYATDHELWTGANDMNLRLHVRRSGYNRPLVHEHHRIQELYKLSDTDVVRAMLGLDSTVSTWRAEALENSGYCQLMHDQDGVFSGEVVRDAYGYNAVAKLTADTPQWVEVQGEMRYVDVPPGLQQKSTAYEYDSNGRLVNVQTITDQNQYTVSDANTQLVEILTGHGGEGQSTVFGASNDPINLQYNHRFYTCPIIEGEPTYEWTDVTGTDEYQVDSNGIVLWETDLSRYLVAVRADDDFLSYEIPLDSSDGLVRFTITSVDTWYGIANESTATIPPGRLDIWLNGHSLIEGLDYVVHWPQIVITNKEYLNGGGSETVRVRASGFCNPDITRHKDEDVGFVEYGLISHNARFNLRDDRVVRIIAGGGVKHRDQLKFAEDKAGLTFDGIPNGTPYAIRNIDVPVRNLDTDIFEYRQRSRDLDNEIADYLSLKLPEPDRELPSPIEHRYRIYSPFCSKVLHDLQDGFIGGEWMETYYGEEVIHEKLENYKYLIPYDPTVVGYDKNYVAVHPHNYDQVVDLNIFQYNFLQRAINALLDSAIDISSHVRMVELNNE